MPSHILVAINSARFADYVLAHAQTIAHASNARITLLRLFEGAGGKNRNRIVDPLDWHIRKLELEASLSKMAEPLLKKGLTVDTAVLEGDDAKQLIQYVQENNVDLIVLTKQAENVDDFLHEVMKSTLTPVVILTVGDHVRKNTNFKECYEKILVPLDGSQRAEITLPIANMLAKDCNAQLLLAHVVRRPEMPRHAPPKPEETRLVDRLVEINRNEAGRYLENFASRLPGEVKTHLLVSDNIVTSLHQLVEQEDVDIIVLSAHGYSGEPNWPYGSVTNHLIAYSTKPVLVVQDLPTNISDQTEAPALARSGRLS